jgi:hypothetical protein
MPEAEKQNKPHLENGENIEKLHQLMKRWGISDGDYLGLALRLAKDHPSFRPASFKLKHGDYGAVVRANKGGRPTEWTPDKLDQLLTDVDAAKKKFPGSTDEEALRIITQKGKWARPPNRDQNKWIKDLKNTLANARRINRDVNRLLERLEEIRRENPGNSCD